MIETKLSDNAERTLRGLNWLKAALIVASVAIVAILVLSLTSSRHAHKAEVLADSASGTVETLRKEVSTNREAAMSGKSLADNLMALCGDKTLKIPPVYCSQAVSVQQEAGAAAKPGVPGSPGVPGKDGLRGRDGADGTPGKAGAAGAAGADGSNGEPGKPGLNGINGAAGADGTDGAQGPQGEPGVQGPPGTDGAPGVPGPQGVQGLPGVPGEPGTAPATWTFTFLRNTFTCVMDAGAPVTAPTYSCVKS